MFAFFNNVPERGFVWNFGNEQPSIKAPIPEQQKQLDEYRPQHCRGEEQATISLQPKIEQGSSEVGEEAPQRQGTARLDRHRRPETASRQGGIASSTARASTMPEQAGPKFNYRDPFTFAAMDQPGNADRRASIAKATITRKVSNTGCT